MILCVCVYIRIVGLGLLCTYSSLLLSKAVCPLTIVYPFGCMFVHSEGCSFNCNCVRVDCKFNVQRENVFAFPPGYEKMCVAMPPGQERVCLSAKLFHPGIGIMVTFRNAFGTASRKGGASRAPPPGPCEKPLFQLQDPGTRLAPPGGLPPAPRHGSSQLIGRVRDDVVGSQKEIPAPGAPEVFFVSSGYLRPRFLTWPLQPAARLSAAHIAAAMVSPVTVVSEGAASEPVSPAAGAPRFGDWAAAGQAAGGRGSAGILRRPAAPGGRRALVRPPPPQTRGAPPPCTRVRPRERGQQWARDSEA